MFYRLLSTVFDADGNNSGNSYVSIELNSQSDISTEVPKNGVNAVLCCIVLTVGVFLTG